MIYTKGRVMRIFISGKITGADDYMAHFEEVEDKLTKRGYEVVNPAKILAAVPFELPWDKHTDITLTLLRECDAIYLLRNWIESDSAGVEHCYARKLKLSILHEKLDVEA